ncbi:MAG: TolC family protein, partial [Bacteriovoracaceae bacterium]|nr:TolC family protein [Bacteriovoracaceae bacterium]
MKTTFRLIASVALMQFIYIHHVYSQIITLEEYLKEVQLSNPTIEASRLRALALEHRIDPSRTLEDPFIAAGIDEVPFSGGAAGLRRYQVSQSFPFPGKLSTRGEVAEKKADSGKYEAETMQRQIKVLATQVYLRTVYNVENLRLNQRIQGVLGEISSSAKARYRTGDNSHHEWLLAKLEL